MNVASATVSTFRPWTDEPASSPNRRKIRARIGGLHCSLCTGTIEKALGQMPGVDKVAVSLTHEQALVEYDPAVVRPEQFLQTLRDIGFTISDPRKLRPFEEEERDLVHEARRFVLAVVLSVASIPIIADPSVGWIGFLPALVCLSLGAFVFLVLRSTGFWVATASFFGLAAMSLTLLYLNLHGYLLVAAPWLTGALALVLVFGVGRHILHMAVQALRRGILNQHVLLEIGAFAGIAGGVIGLVLNRPDYPTAPFFAVSVMVGTYHIFSEWLSLLVKTRSSQAVKRLLDLQPDTARVVRDGKEVELPIEEVRINDLVRVRPGERIPADSTVVSGRSGVDQSLVTGESIPVEKTEGDSVIGGSINGTGTLLVRVAAIGEGSFLSQVIRHVEDARALKPGLLHLVDRVLRIYTPSVLLIAALAVIGCSDHGSPVAQ
jgi:cation transport ATPase